MTTVDCPHAVRCAGCPLITLPIEAQLAHKHESVRRAMARFGLDDGPPVAAVRPAEPTIGYRTRAKLVVAPGPRLGLYARDADHEVVDIPDCRVLSPAIGLGAAAIRRLLFAPPRGAEQLLRPERDRGGMLRAVDLREVLEPGGAASVLVTLVLAAPPRGAARSPRRRAPDAVAQPAHEARRASPDGPASHALRVAAEALMELAPSVRTVAVSWHRGLSPQLLGDAPENVLGAAHARDALLSASGLYVHAAPGSFSQVHRGQAAAIYRRAADWLSGQLGDLQGAEVLEAFAGSGGLGLLLAQRGARVTMVESFGPAATAAARAAAEQGFDVEVRVADATAEIVRRGAAGGRPVAMVVNPPRSGLPSRLRTAAAALAPRAIVYVSCDPETLARDLADLARLGWRAERLEPYDMIPLTEQVETLALLRPGEPSSPRVIDRTDGLLVVDKPPHEPLGPTPQVSSLVDRLRREGSQWATVVVVHGIDPSVSGLCLLAGSAGEGQRWGERLRTGPLEQRYLVLCRGLVRSKGVVRAEGRPAARGPVASAAESTRAANAGRSGPRGPTRYRRIGVAAGHSLLVVDAPGARTEWLRRHLARIGHPVLGDDRFGHAPSNRHLAQSHGLDRPFIHRFHPAGPRGPR